MSRPFLVMAVVLAVFVEESLAVYTTIVETDLRIILYTSTIDHADTDDAVYVRIFGTKGQKTSILTLNNPGDDREKGSVDTYRLTTKFVGTPLEMEVWGGQDGDGWYLNKVELESDDAKDVFDAWVWACYCWFDSDKIIHGMKVTRRILTRPRVIKKRKWKIWTFTGEDFRGGSKDATWIKLHGIDAISGWMPLNRQGSTLYRNQKSPYYISVSDVIRAPEDISIRGAESGDAWLLIKVYVETWIDGKRWVYVYNCGEWFDSDQSPFITSRRLPRSSIHRS